MTRKEGHINFTDTNSMVGRSFTIITTTITL